MRKKFLAALTIIILFTGSIIGITIFTFKVILWEKITEEIELVVSREMTKVEDSSLAQSPIGDNNFIIYKYYFDKEENTVTAEAENRATGATVEFKAVTPDVSTWSSEQIGDMFIEFGKELKYRGLVLPTETPTDTQ